MNAVRASKAACYKRLSVYSDVDVSGMSLTPPPPGRRRPHLPTAKIKTKLRTIFSRTSAALPDTTFTLLQALAQSADAFPPLKSAVGGVIALWTVAQRAKHCKSEATAVARRADAILSNIADAIPDATSISPAMLQSITQFTLLLNNICSELDQITSTSTISRIVHVNRNEQTLKQMLVRLGNVYDDFLVAATLRIEHAQTRFVARITVQQDAVLRDTRAAVDTAANTVLAELKPYIFYSLSRFFWPSPE